MSQIFFRLKLFLSLALTLTPLCVSAELGVNDFRGSSFIYSNTMSLTSLDQGAEMSYNPYYGMQFTVAPRYWFVPRSFVSARLTVDKELTEPDDTTYRDETRLSDLNLGLGSILHSWDFGLTTFGSLGMQLPTSLAAQARTLNLGLSGNLFFTQALGGFGSVSYSFGLTHSFFDYTTGEIESPRVSSCASSASGCDPFLNTGVRNAPWRAVHSASLSLFPLSWLFVSASAAWIESYLFPAAQVDQSLVTFTPQEPTNKRVAMSYGLEVDLQPKQWLIIALMLNTFNPQLAPDSTYYRPFINRFTSAQIDLRFTLGVFRVAQATGGSDAAKAPKKLKSSKKPKPSQSSSQNNEGSKGSAESNQEAEASSEAEG